MYKYYRAVIATLLICICANIEPAFASPVSTEKFEAAGIDVTVHYSNDEAVRYADRLEDIVRQGLTEHRDLFGGLPKDAEGKPYTKLTINVGSGFGGEADPGRIDISISDFELFGIYGWEMIVLHELFHLWSAETFRYADGREQWFNEGVAEYYTLRTAARIGLIPNDKIIPTFAAPLGYYLSARGLGELSMREAGATDKLKRDHYFLVYHGGYSAALYMDFRIRRDTKNQKSLDDLMRHLYRNFSIEKPYTMKSLVSSLRYSTSVDFSSFVKEFVDGKKVIPMGQDINFGELYFKVLFQSEDFESDEVVLLNMLGM